jgi:hypothetical protein
MVLYTLQQRARLDRSETSSILAAVGGSCATGTGKDRLYGTDYNPPLIGVPENLGGFAEFQTNQLTRPDYPDVFHLIYVSVSHTSEELQSVCRRIEKSAEA